jgi:predicted deacylase
MPFAVSPSAARPLPLPPFDIQIAPPDLGDWRAGNTGIAGYTTLAAAAPGPHVALIALTHGNEYAGAIALDRLLRAGLRPSRGRLTFGFNNLAAFDRFDARQPTASRFVEEDFNRIWDPAVLDGPRQSAELARARAIRPLIETVDILFDIHSMLWPSDPLLLCGEAAQGRRLAFGVGIPELVVADRGHASGRRLIDYPRFTEAGAAAVLVEAGQHWDVSTVDLALASVAGLLRHLDVVEAGAPLPPPVQAGQRFAEVTTVVTAGTGGFSFVQPFRGGEVVAAADTVIAHDGEQAIRTPHDECLLVMPSLRPSRGHTAVRLARFVPGGADQQR